MQKARNWAENIKKHEKILKFIVRNEEMNISSIIFYWEVSLDSTFTNNPLKPRSKNYSWHLTKEQGWEMGWDTKGALTLPAKA